MELWALKLTLGAALLGGTLLITILSYLLLKRLHKIMPTPYKHYGSLSGAPSRRPSGSDDEIYSKTKQDTETTDIDSTIASKKPGYGSIDHGRPPIFPKGSATSLVSRDKASDQDASLDRRRLCIGLVLSLLNCFAGGVFLATAFLHMIPETKEHYEQYTTIGYLLEYTAQQPSHNSTGNSEHEDGFPVPEFLTLGGLFVVYYIEALVLTIHDVVITKKSRANSLDVAPKEKQVDSAGSLFDAVSLICALCLHSGLEGLAIGISLDADALILRLLTISVHKAIIAFTTGLTVARATITRSRGWLLFLGLCGVFAITSPIGMLVGTVLTSSIGSGITPWIILLEGLSAGTFLYIAFFEVLGGEHDKESRFSLARASSTLLGVLLVALIVWRDSSH